MASLASRSVLRANALSTPSKRLLSNRALMQSLRSPSITRGTPSSLSKSTPFSPRSCLPRTAAFHTTARRNILPMGPQVIDGGINEAAPVPKPSPTHGSYHWTFERLLSVALVPLTIAPFAAGSISPVVDAMLVFGILIHSHIGFQSCVIDYFPTTHYPGLRRAADWLLNIATIAVGVAFYEFETNDIGFAAAIKRIWHAGVNDATVGAADLDALGNDGKLKHLTK